MKNALILASIFMSMMVITSCASAGNERYLDKYANRHHQQDNRPNHPKRYRPSAAHQNISPHKYKGQYKSTNSSQPKREYRVPPYGRFSESGW